MERKTQKNTVITAYKFTEAKIIVTTGLIIATLVVPTVFFVSHNPSATQAVTSLTDWCGCGDTLAEISSRWDTTGLAIGVALLSWIVFTALRIAFIQRNTRRFIKKLRAARIHQSTAVSTAAQFIGCRYAIHEVVYEKPYVCSYGIIRREILISTATVEVLHAEELAAVLAHEAEHLDNHEPLKLLFAKSLVGVFGFLPGIRSLANQFYLVSELRADAAAVDVSGTRSLASALLKLLGDGRESAYAISHFADVHGTSVRINSLNGTLAIGREKGIVRACVSLCAILFLLLGIIGTISHAQASGASRSLATCVQRNAQRVPYCAQAAITMCEYKIFGAQSMLEQAICE